MSIPVTGGLPALSRGYTGGGRRLSLQRVDQRLQRRDGRRVRLAVDPLGPEVALEGVTTARVEAVVDAGKSRP